jgi:Cys-tRNA(Pro)/Cys-tRNA(Cys) deacylase
MTRGVQMLEKAGVAYSLHTYSTDVEGDSYGQAVARALGVGPGRLFKTLLAAVDGLPVVGIVPVSGRLGMKALARAAGGKKADMVPPADAERITGYVTGGISPFGQKKRLPVFVDSSILDYDTIFCSAGQRGLQVELAPADVVALLAATLVDLAEE